VYKRLLSYSLGTLKAVISFFISVVVGFVTFLAVGVAYVELSGNLLKETSNITKGVVIGISVFSAIASFVLSFRSAFLKNINYKFFTIYFFATTLVLVAIGSLAVLASSSFEGGSGYAFLYFFILGPFLIIPVSFILSKFHKNAHKVKSRT
jgi:hypothetical protein